MNISQILSLKSPNNYKLHFAIGPKDKKEPLYAFWKNEFKEWQEWQSRKNFERPLIVSLIYYNNNEWLFAGIYKVLGRKRKDDHLEYITKLTNQHESLIGRLIIKYPKSFRAVYVKLEKYLEDLELSEILKTPSSFQKFPGYQNTSISFSLLSAIVEKNELSWQTALKNMKGVYLITDCKTGKLYVGSAYGEYAIWSRWKNYIAHGHGGNVGLIELISEKGKVYAEKYFQFSILEVFKLNRDDEDIIQRETYWKKVLKSKDFGYNKN